MAKNSVGMSDLIILTPGKPAVPDGIRELRFRWLNKMRRILRI